MTFPASSRLACWLGICLLVGGVGWSAPGLAASEVDEQRWSIFSADGRQAGEQTVRRGKHGWLEVSFRYKDNGRGPELLERLRLDADGHLLQYDVTGSDTMGAAVDEHFRHAQGRAEWRSSSDHGEREAQPDEMYVPLNGSWVPTELMALALARKGPRSRLSLLPSGQLSQQVLAVLALDRPAGAVGPLRRQVQLVAQTGLGLSPTFLWLELDPRGRAIRLFASIEPGAYAVVPTGWQAAIPALTARQHEAMTALQTQLAGQYRHPLPGVTALRNVRIFDSDTARLGAPADVHLLRGRITAVTPAGAIAARADQEVDGAGRVLLPGLFDLHAHLGPWDGRLHLAAGVTTVRDMGNDNLTLQRHIDDIGAGRLLGPQVVPAGFLEGESPYAARNGFVISTREQAELAVDWYASHGYPQLKIYNSFPQELVPSIVARAHARGLRVSGHVPVHLRASEVVEAGFDEIQHINQVLLNFLVKPDTDTRTLDRFYLPARELADLDLDSEPVQDFVRLLLRNRVSIDPTLGTFDFIQQRAGQLSTPMAAVASHLPPDVQRSLRVGGLEMPDDATARRFASSYAKMLDFVGRLYRAGVPLVAGTDNIAGFTLHAELALYVKAGLTPAQALQIATRNGALYSRTPDRGRVAPGLLADLVLIDGDPTRDIDDLRKVALVITQGQWLRPADIHQAMGIAPFTSWAPVPR